MIQILITISLFFALSSFNFIQAQSSANNSATKQAKLIYGTASYYANFFEGRQTANGEIFRQDRLTAACNVLPLNTWIRVTNLVNGRSVLVKVNDRMHPRMKRVVDLSRAAAIKLGFIHAGLAKVRVEVLGKRKPEG